LIKLLFLLFFVPYSIYASVVASVDSTKVEIGDMVTYSLNISGEDISRPNIQRLCDTDVISTASQTSINMINGNMNKSYILSYKFIPQKSCDIPAMKVEIAGKTELSNPVSFKVGAVVGAKDKDFILELSTNKKEVLVGETFNLILVFKQKEGSEAVDNEFIAPKLKGFWVKKEAPPIRYKDGRYAVSKIIYTLAAQREGKLDIKQAKMRIASRSHSRGSWGGFIPNIKWKTYFSNPLSIDVKALPLGVDLVGDFSIKTIVDKNEINSNEAVNVTVEVVGDGNLEDIKSFKPKGGIANVFDEKININGQKLTQKMAFVSERDFDIPAFTLKYYDLETKEIKTISTKEIAIKVNNTQAKEKLVIKREENTKPEALELQTSVIDMSKTVMLEFFLLGLVIGMSLIYFKPWKFVSSKKEKTFSINDNKALLMKLLPFKDDIEVQKLVSTLEKNIYSNSKDELDKKKIKEVLKKYKVI